MKFSVAAAIATILLPTFTLATTLSYDERYDVSSASLDTVACSNGENGLITQGYTTFGSLPAFPYIGGAEVVTGWNSPNCGTCWNLTYTNAKGKSTSISILAIDYTKSGFNIALEAMNELTGGVAREVGRVDIASKKIAPSHCGL